jgi:hypothetical protein
MIPEATAPEKCRLCRQAPVAEFWDVCQDCTRRVEHPQAGDGCTVSVGSASRRTRSWSAGTASTGGA